MAKVIGWHAAVNDTVLLFYCKTAISKKQDIMQVFPGRRFSQEFWQLKFLYKSHQWLADFHHLYWIFWPKRRIRRWLAALDWPGDRSLSSAEFQARQAFLAALDGLGRYDELLTAVTADEARRRLAEICAERVFQPETRGNPAIEILGVLESTRLAFDALWVMGMNDDAWPPPPRPNPLLPAEIQRRAGTPHASADVELAFAQTVHRRLLTAAPAITFSWRRQDGARFLRPSPLIADLPVAPEPVLHPGTMEPVTPDFLSVLFPMALIQQEVSTERYIEIPEPVREIYRLWRPTPLIRATFLEKALDTPAHIYFKNESVSPVGSHKPITSVPQAYYNKEAGTRAMATETGAGQWQSCSLRDRLRECNRPILAKTCF